MIDAYEQALDGLSRDGCPRPAHHAVYAVLTPCVDTCDASHGMADPRESSTLRAACHWFGDPCNNIKIDGPDEPLRNWRSPYYSEISTMLSFLALPVYVLGSARGALFVPQMDKDAFPPLRRQSLPLRAGRRVIQSLLGLRH